MLNPVNSGVAKYPNKQMIAPPTLKLRRGGKSGHPEPERSSVRGSPEPYMVQGTPTITSLDSRLRVTPANLTAMLN